jgi:NhaP-type Na+/H+ or K+/H+ antiporter
MKVDEKLYTLIFGESILNDSVAIVSLILRRSCSAYWER